jgi:hypothetical protein
MSYKFIAFSSNVSPVYSSVMYIWQEVKSGDYYIDCPVNGDMLLHPGVTDTNKSYYKEQLSSYAKKITQYEKLSGVIELDGSRWKLNF